MADHFSEMILSGSPVIEKARSSLAGPFCVSLTEIRAMSTAGVGKAKYLMPE
jgi:hypothetical protein